MVCTCILINGPASPFHCRKIRRIDSICSIVNFVKDTRVQEHITAGNATGETFAYMIIFIYSYLLRGFNFRSLLWPSRQLSCGDSMPASTIRTLISRSYPTDPYIPCYKQRKQSYPFFNMHILIVTLMTIFYFYFQMCYQDGPPLPMDKHMLWTFQPCQLHLFPSLCSCRMYTCCYYFNMFCV